ncbi:MAG: type 2 isopentenyl-diphosphate Delta-isomerase [Candidatus Competibacterales bacterium]
MHQQRKADHIRINLDCDVGFDQLTTGLEDYRFVHQALPELNLAEVDTRTTLLGKALALPLVISSMTGGTGEALPINRRLAEVAQLKGLALGVGSQRAALEDPALAASFAVRDIAPDALLMANLGAVQLNCGYGVDHCRRAVEMIGADALILHFNPLQEAVQPEGDTCFKDLYPKVAAVCRALEVPVVAKEVGWGFDPATVRRLGECGVAAVDIAGAGGTSWSQVEMYRAKDPVRRRIAATFRDWGIPTSQALGAAHRAVPGLPLIASGGLRTGLDVAKCLALGAVACAMAGPFLKAAVESTAAVLKLVEVTAAELAIAMFATGHRDLEALKDTPRLQRVGRLD